MKLKLNWLISNYPIKNIRIENCALKIIESRAFINFTNTNSLTIINSQISSLKRDIFEGLSNLQSFTLQDNLINEVEYDLLGKVAESLETIQLDRSLVNYQVLLNITMGNPLFKVQLVSLQGNNIPNISSELLQGFPNVVSLYLDNSRISNVHRNAFQSVQTLQQIFINNNLITTLPSGLFNTILHYYPGFKLAATNNPWNCNCDLQWLQQMMINYPGIMLTIPRCLMPEINNDKSFVDAKFCSVSNLTDIESSTTNASIISSTENSPINRELINVTCQNSQYEINYLSGKLFNTTDYEFQPKSTDFHLQELNNGTILVNLKNHDNNVTILWFKVTNNDNIIAINCLKNLKGSVQLKNFDADSLYTICLLELKYQLSPFNCLGLKTAPAKNARIWLSNGDKAIILSIYSLTLIVFCLLGCGICLLIVRKNPSLLKGSKRIVMVKHGQINAMVLPKGINLNNKKKKLIETTTKNSLTQIKLNDELPSYLTPIERRKLGLTNTYESIRSKISIIKDFGLVNNNNRESFVITDNDNNDRQPPPLPPRPLHGVIPSLSLSVDSEHKIGCASYQNYDDTTGIYSCS